MLLEMVGILTYFVIIGYCRVHASSYWYSNVSGDVLAILDLRPDESLYEAGVAREVCCKLLT